MTSELAGDLQVVSQNLYDISSTSNQNIGEAVFTNDGRVFKYAKSGASDLIAGNLLQSSAETTAHQNLTAVAAAIGDTSIAASTTVTLTANEYSGGWAIITTGPGIGHAFKISGHAAFTAAAPTLQLSNPISGVALTTSSRIDLVRNAYMSVIQNPTTATSGPVGVNSVGTLTTLFFGWIQVAGVSPVLADGALVVGSNVGASNGTAGAVEPLGQAGVPGTQALVGIAQTGVATGEIGAVRLQGLL